MEHHRKASAAAMSYADRREAIYTPLRQEGIFNWDCMYGDEYALADLYRIDRELHGRILQAAEGLTQIYARTVQIVQQSDDALLEQLGLPRASFGAVRLSLEQMLPTLVGRFDFAVNGQEIKMLEFNSDTPTGIVEAFHVNGHVCAAYGAEDPNAGCDSMLRTAFDKAINVYREAGYSTEQICFSALDWHDEDAGTTRYLLERSGLPARFAPLSQLRVLDDRLWVMDDMEQLQPVQVLYRLHALEKLAEEHDEDGYPTGEHVLQLIADRKLAVINPPSGFLAQTKALQALIWSLHEEGHFFSSEEHRIIESHMLPTYLENRFEGAEMGASPYVVKPIFGREGSGVSIYNADGSTLDLNNADEYSQQPMVYQQYTKLPTIDIETLNGSTRGSMLWGCFVIGGRASAIIPRVGGPITNNLSYYLPVGFK
ncbi:glutathionylspermidine synthase family protein [Paenibacillus radicis (ex Xue et al. 2023)]|uniref:Glutathionylspermidine synthase family protein n=1 Tax=Paenibacillus radicis (ex Xue et al. 2023) TaxID=2972489 RepID=A0ABT1YKD6_9BACL|nr:glutathionylspermidine synthase family protein [Paenibacillus radicis (ex Xue et al. 2023)]MCR8633649.1 glutathionylspermidine synthase family protein [Paenibacillus radicis (ex Xue et al. 2023)]